jgi:hypothetical protein
MEKGDIGITLHKYVACMFEGLLCTVVDDAEVPKRRRLFGRDAPAVKDKDMAKIVRSWQPNEMPIKSVIHLTKQLGIGVEVYTYYPEDFIDPIERWLGRKGISVTVHSYDDVMHLMEDFKFNRDVQVLFTASERDAQLLGMRSTVVSPDHTFGF